MDFDKRSASRESLLDVFGSEGKVEEPDSLKSRAYSIILHRASISSSYLICVDAIAAAMVKVTALEIECCIARSIAREDMLELSS